MTIERRAQPPIRSLLYVPGNKLDWMLKAPKYGADALIFDLEDAVPPEQKVASRAIIRQALEALAAQPRPRLFVRINGMTTGLARDDLAAVICPALFGVYLPKADGPEEIAQLDAWLGELEAAAGLEAGRIFIRPLLETARGHRECYEIAMASPRVAYLGTGGGGQGDIARALGYRETPSGLETLYLRSKVLLDVRTAGITNPIGGLWDRIHDLDGLRAHCERERSLGYQGLHAIHPSHVPIINEVFSPTPEEVAYWQGLVAAVEAGQRQGTAAVVYAGRMVDIAHLTHARDMVALAAQYGIGSEDG
jgi:citrate lyase subunit beta/citryl-CoA lyase